MSIKRIMEAVKIDYDDELDIVRVSTDYNGEVEIISMPYIQFEKAYESILEIRGNK
jgi:hypothetical protein